MALPVKAAASLAKDMASKSLITGPPSAPAETEEDKNMPADDADDGMSALLDEADKLVPGLGDLLQEFADRIKGDDKEQDEEDAVA